MFIARVSLRVNFVSFFSDRVDETMLVVLVRRIHGVSRGSSTTAVAKQFRFVARGIAESGFLYSSISLAHFAVWFTSNNFAIQMVSLLVSVPTYK